MTISKELFLALLSMDAYNRGYEPGVGGLPKPEDGFQIGLATYLTDSTDKLGLTDTQAAGFYAIAYSLPDGSKVISYRGTDQNAPALFAGTGIGSDAINGYGLALGSPYSGQAA